MCRSQPSGSFSLNWPDEMLKNNLSRIAGELFQAMNALGNPGVQTCSLPVSADFLLAPQNVSALLGDLQERHKVIHKKFGKRRADLWYWTQAIRSVGPIVWAWAKKAALKPVIGVIAWAVTKGLVGNDSWLTTLVAIWKRIRH